MQLSLASLAAPKLGRAPGIADEQFAWDSREFLRKKCIGKQVCLSVNPAAVYRTWWLHSHAHTHTYPTQTDLSLWTQGARVGEGGVIGWSERCVSCRRFSEAARLSL